MEMLAPIKDSLKRWVKYLLQLQTLQQTNNCRVTFEYQRDLLYIWEKFLQFLANFQVASQYHQKLLHPCKFLEKGKN